MTRLCPQSRPRVPRPTVRQWWRILAGAALGLCGCGAVPRAETLAVTASASSGDAVQRGRTAGSSVDWQRTQSQLGAALGASYTANQVWSGQVEAGALRGRVSDRRGDAPGSLGGVAYLWAARLGGAADGKWLGAAAAANVWWAGQGTPRAWPTLVVKFGAIGQMWGELRAGPDRLWSDANLAGGFFRLERGLRGGATVGLGALSRQLAATEAQRHVPITDVQPGVTLGGWLPVGQGQVELTAVIAESSRVGIQYRLPLLYREPKGARSDSGPADRPDDLELTRPW